MLVVVPCLYLMLEDLRTLTVRPRRTGAESEAGASAAD
jgi:hypothetical protein